PAQSLLDLFSARHVASRPMANTNQRAAGRPLSKHVIKRRNACGRGGRNLGHRANRLQRLLRDIAVMALQPLENRNKRMTLASATRDNFFDGIKLNAWHRRAPFSKSHARSQDS